MMKTLPFIKKTKHPTKGRKKSTRWKNPSSEKWRIFKEDGSLKEQEHIKCLNPQVVRSISNEERRRTPKRTPNLEEPSHTDLTQEVMVTVWVLVHLGCKADGCSVDLKCFFHVIPVFNSLDCYDACGCWLLLEIVGVTSLCKFLCQFQQFKILQYTLATWAHVCWTINKIRGFNFWQVIYFQIFHQNLYFSFMKQY